MTSRTLPPAQPKKKHPRSLFYRVSAWLHLWLGLVTGIIMVIVCVMACVWVFNDEITTLLEPETRVARQEAPVLPPSRLKAIADSVYPGKRMNYAMYQQGKAAYVVLGEGRRGNTTLRVNPYTGHVISIKEQQEGEVDFFRWALNGHRFLWLPYKIGRPVVNYGTLIFVFILITGMVLWWPKKWKKSTREKSFSIKWKASFKRVNYDLHNVLGFYSLVVVLAMALTGMVYGIEWYSKSMYWATTGGKTLHPFGGGAVSDSLQLGRHFTPVQAMDAAWAQVVTKHPEAQGFYYSFADTSKPKSTISITIYPTAGKFYNHRNYQFDQHTAKMFPSKAPAYEEASAGEKLRKMNYDIHVGSILGFPGKVLAFFGSLIGASLPITGFIIWYGKKRKKPAGKKPLNRRTAADVEMAP
ncbi:PepSY domain-containing protein [Chitinophaga lutea]|uniref:PepSY domain-containing protein n=1 Tax=Chitinophaga lutea TaxID=2488634 RepID=A0A3N4QE09_9BACT|nr:PepSY-associated TM helix domain-containing protein [Chitinophaga lutea]RPE14197.1 PepSY domain-containing protein [Chitinophaga lutea]